MAVVLQVQVSLFAQGDYLGLRIGLGDLFLPFIGVFVLHSLARRKSRWPDWSVRSLWYWLGALVLVLSASLFNGWIVTGSLSGWALINKYLGFFILVGYLALGGWIATNTQDMFGLLSRFASCFCAFFIVCIGISVVGFLMRVVFAIELGIGGYQWEGFMANRNAFMLVFILSMLFVMYSYRDDNFNMPQVICDGFWVCFPVFFLYNGSRTGVILSVILCLVFLGFSFNKNYLRRVLVAFLVGGLITGLCYHVNDNKHIARVYHVKRLVTLAVGGVDTSKYDSDKKRFIAVEDGLELYQRYDPIVGAGLGTYKPFQIEKRGEFVEVIDFTALWLLTEMGVSGLFVFSAFFIVCAASLYQNGYKPQGSSYHRAVFVFLILFAGMTLLHELMYTRILWFIMGLALVSGRDEVRD
ncbi:MAG: O-antigen ligase family protein [Alphaproteobacteria bacterium]